MKTNNELKDLHGEEYAASYEVNQSPFRLPRLIKFMAIDETHDIVDFACGNGMLMPFICPKVKSYTGVDFSEAIIRSANEKKKRLSIHNAEFICSEIVQFCERKQNSFDVGFALDFSEHVYDDEWLRILKGIKSSIKPNGKLYLHTPNAEFFLEKMKSRNFIYKQIPQHVGVRTPAENINLLKKAGFNVTIVRLIPHYNVFRFVHPLSYIPLVGKYFKGRIFIEAIS